MAEGETQKPPPTRACQQALPLNIPDSHQANLADTLLPPPLPTLYHTVTQEKESLSVTDFDGSFARNSTYTHKPAQRPWFVRRSYYTDGWTDPSIWKAAVVESVGTSALVWLSGQFGMTIGGYGDKDDIGSHVAIWSGVLIASGIYATAPASGGHLNPLITWSTVLAGLCPVPRGCIYILFQMLGAAVAGGLLLGTWGDAKTVASHATGCWFDPAELSAGQVLLLEICSSFYLVFLAFGVGLDPRQAVIFGPQLGPALVGAVFGLVAFVTTGTAPGYLGAGLNPARCFALSIARRDFSYYWIWFLGPAIAAVLQGVLYNLIPPWHASGDHKKKQRVS